MSDHALPSAGLDCVEARKDGVFRGFILGLLFMLAVTCFTLWQAASQGGDLITAAVNAVGCSK